MPTHETIIIGAGPAGSVAAALLRQQGRKVLIVEREQFPRFSIGESLLPQSMEYIEAAGLLQDVVEAGFQYKNGAAFVRGERTTEFDFRNKFSAGWGTTYQVQRGDFDHVLAKGAERMGAEVRYRHEVLAVEPGETPQVTVRSPEGEEYVIEADFLKVRTDDFLCVSISISAVQPHFLCRPQAKKFAAPCFQPEFHFLIVGIFLLKSIFAVLKARHIL